MKRKVLTVLTVIVLVLYALSLAGCVTAPKGKKGKGKAKGQKPKKKYTTTIIHQVNDLQKYNNDYEIIDNDLIIYN